MDESVRQISELSEFNKLRIYMHYYITQLSLKKDFDFVINKDSVEYKYLWKNNYIKEFEEFCSEKNIDKRDMGENWQKLGFAQRHWIQLYGIYEWYWKFKDEIKLDYVAI